jgi:hypothetical protein
LGDFREVVKNVQADAINLDPPWGGPSYKELGRFLLEHFSPDGNELLRLAFEQCNEVIIRVPTIFDMSEFDKFDATYEVFDDAFDGRAISKTVIFRKS